MSMKYETWLRRFWARVEKSDGCWRWLGHKNPYGYGVLKWQGSGRMAHRVSYEVSVGDIPEGLELDHLCRNRECVRPDHLEPVTHQENVARAVAAAVRTACRNGHPPDDLTNPYKDGSRRCRQCRRDVGLRRYDVRDDERGEINAKRRARYAVRKNEINAGRRAKSWEPEP